MWAIVELLLGVDLLVTPGSDEPQAVGLGSVLAASLAAGAAGWALLAVPEATTRRGLRLWQAVAALALLVSLAGPVAGVGAAVVASLTAMHLAVAAVLVGVLTVTSPQRQPGRGPGQRPAPA